MFLVCIGWGIIWIVKTMVRCTNRFGQTLKSEQITNGVLIWISVFLNSTNASSSLGMHGLHVVISAHLIDRWFPNSFSEVYPWRQCLQ
jgi:hypothetical protein